MNGVFIFVGLIALLFMAWAGTGGPERDISFQGPYLRPIENTGQTAEAYGESREAQRPGVIGSWLSGIGTTGGAGGSAEISAEDASPYRGLVAFVRGPSGVQEEDPDEEFVRITLNAQASSPVRITGWTLRNGSGTVSIPIPSGVATLRSGNVNQAGDISLAPGEEAIIVSGRSPTGVSFRENMCTGYLEERQDFFPPLLNACPSASEEYTQAGGNDQECKNYLYRINYCETDTSNDADGACEAFIESNLTYNGCIRAHEQDANFPGVTWRLFLNSREGLWSDARDTIRLLDESGKTVDVLSY